VVQTRVSFMLKHTLYICTLHLCNISLYTYINVCTYMHRHCKPLHPLCSWVWQLPRYVRFVVAGNTRFPYKHWCSTLSIFVQLTVTCNTTATTHTECNVVLPLQQWLRERATILRHIYVVCLVCVQRVMSRVAFHLFSSLSLYLCRRRK